MRLVGTFKTPDLSNYSMVDLGQVDKMTIEKIDGEFVIRWYVEEKSQ